MAKSRTRLILLTVAAATSAALALTGCANRSGGGGGDAADFPSKQITFYTPTQAGGATDLTARTLAEELEAELGQALVVDNRPGGAGSVGMAHLAGLEPDGYSIMVFPVEVSLLGHQGYDTDPADYDFLGIVNEQPGAIAVPADSPYQTLEDLVSAAAEQPGSVTVSNAGPGSIWEVGALELGRVADVEFQGVPFDGGAPAVTAAVGKQVDAVVAGAAEMAQAHADGQLRVLAVFTEEPVPVLEDVPTAGDAGFDVVIGSWAAIGAPAGLDDGVKETLESALEVAATSDAYTSFIEKSGNIPVFVGADDAAEFVQAEHERFAELLAE
ncbi:tripartite tricarboxylate transporter substrate binding protein [Microbacterium sp. Marseille-Q6965]|uniref:tripartite tricarboxylate transporter substrate binding protein n=1 Tax=Microbacterium sp. Marseille-Q6965 TaxID=2965072 RepID=UPI0021B7D4D8|nr:tripartite tricarboxylate transporter substrate binding protein [Microbacterium sp. Marseille-Q6965]